MCVRVLVFNTAVLILMSQYAKSLLENNSFGLRQINLSTDLKIVHKIFSDGMRLYSDPLPVTSPLRVMWEQYIPNSIANDLSNIKEVYLNSGGNFWVVYDKKENDCIVGCVGCEPLSKITCELRRMSVSQKARRGGLGSLLVRVVEEFAAENGFKQLILSTGSNMTPARGLYERNGFEMYKYESSESNDMKEAGETFGIVHFRKPITRSSGRWMWSKL